MNDYVAEASQKEYEDLVYETLHFVRSELRSSEFGDRDHDELILQDALKKAKEEKEKTFPEFLDDMTADSEAEARAEHKPTDDFLQGWEGAMETIKKRLLGERE